MKKRNKLFLILACIVCAIFFIAYATLSIVRHNNYQSFGYDLGINDQVIWNYSNFDLPYSTIHPFPGETKLQTHVEIVYGLIAPFYWLWSNAIMSLLLQAFFVCSGGIALYLLAKKRKIHIAINFALLISYLAFYGIQNALWSDVHSASFAAAFLAWFIYFLDSKKFWLTILFALLSITAKENIGLLTLLTSFVYFIKRRDKLTGIIMLLSSLYLLFMYLIYFPHLTNHKYLYQNSNGLFSNLNPTSMFDSQEKRQAIFYSLGSFGFIPLLLPLFLIPIFGDFATYFILASDLTASHGIFMHYRITLAPLLTWATIMTIARHDWLNNKYIAYYLIACTILIQYTLHLPLSYLSKQWFWTQPSGVNTISQMQKELDDTDALVVQNNIIPHVSQRNEIYTLYPEKKLFTTDSPCGEPLCDWFRWAGNPTYLFIDTSSAWDIRHLLTNRNDFIKGLENIEKAGIVTPYKRMGNTTIYKIQKEIN